MVKLSELRTEAEIHEQDMHDEEYRLEVERTRFANEVAIKVIRYRATHGQSQAELAQRLGMRQPNVARLESGEHEPSLSTLARLSLALGLDFSVEVKTGALKLRYPASSAESATRQRRGGRRPSVSQATRQYSQEVAGERQHA